MEKISLNESLLSPFDVNRATPEVAVVETQQGYPYPQDSICKLIVQTEKGKAGGTGFFVHPRIILTAGHCVLAGKGAYVKYMEIVPGLKDDSAPFGVFSSSRFRVNDKYFKKPSYEWDFGFIILDAPGNPRASNSFRLIEDVPRQIGYELSGYPADTIPGDELKKGEQVTFANLQPYKRQKYLMQIPGTFFPGQSGAPVFYRENNIAYACGVYSGSMPGTSFAVRVVSDNILSEYQAVLATL